MAEPVTLQTLLTYLTLISVPVGVFYHIMTLRNTRKNQELTLRSQQQALETRQTQLFIQFNEAFAKCGPAWMEIMGSFGLTGSGIGWSWIDYIDFKQKYGPEHSPENWKKFVSIASLFEQKGILAKEGSVNLQIIYDNIGGSPIRFWDMFEEIIDAQRIELEKPPKGMWMEYFEDLVYTLRDIRADDIRDLDNRLTRRRLRRQELGRTMPDYS